MTIMNSRFSIDRGRLPGFRIRFRGFDRTEVLAAFGKLAAENEDARREIERLADEINRLEVAIAEQSESERHVQRALIAASKLADEMRVRAEAEAHQIRREAQEDGEQIVQRLHDTVRGLEEQIDGLLARRREVEESIGAFIKGISDELDRARQQQGDHVPGSALAEAG